MIIKKTNLVNLNTKFNNHKINFNKSYNSFTSLKNSCNNQILNQLNTKINNYYSKISNDYAKISKYLDDFVKTAQGIENQICSKNVVIPDSQTASAVISYLKELKSCNKEVDTKFQKAVKNFVFSSNNEFANFLSNVNDLDEVLTPEQLKNDETVKTLQEEITKLKTEIDKLENIKDKPEADTKKLEQMQQQFQIISGFLEMYKNNNLENYYNALTLSGDFEGVTAHWDLNSESANPNRMLEYYNCFFYTDSSIDLNNMTKEDWLEYDDQTNYAGIIYNLINEYGYEKLDELLLNTSYTEADGYELTKEQKLFNQRLFGSEYADTATSRDSFRGKYLSQIRDIYNKMEHMTEDEKKLFVYVWQTDGAKGAEQYYKYVEQQLYAREGEELAKEWINKNINGDTSEKSIVKLVEKGFSDGIENFGLGITNSLEATGYIDVSDKGNAVKEYEISYLISYVNSIYGKDAWIGTSAYEIASSIGNMAPSIVMSYIPVVGPFLSRFTFGLSAFGSSYAEAKNMNINDSRALFYGLFSASFEVGLEHFIGKIPGLSKLSGNYIKDIFGEALEEGTQEVLDGLVLSPIFLGEDAKLDWDAIKKSAFYGGITSGILNIGSAPSTINNYINSAKNGGNINEMLNTFKNLFDAKNSDNVQGVKDSLKEIGFNDSEINTIINEKVTTTDSEINPKKEFDMFKDRTNETIERLGIKTDNSNDISANLITKNNDVLKVIKNTKEKSQFDMFYKTKYKIYDKSNNEVGFLNVDSNKKSAILEYEIKKDFQGKGYASSLLSHVITDIFENKYLDNKTWKNDKTNIDTIVLDIAEDNIASIKVAQKNNFHKVSEREFILTKEDYFNIKEESDAFVNELNNKPTPGFENNVSQENIETLFETPSPSGKQVLSQNLYSQMQNSNLNTKEEFKKTSIQEDISKIENAFDLNYNEEYDKGIIDGIRNVTEKNNFSDDNVAKIVKNLDSILSLDQKFGFAVTPGVSSFWGAMHQLCLNTTLLKQSPGVISQTLFHELGHAFLHLAKGDSNNLYKIQLTEENKNIMKKTRDNLRENSQSYIGYLKKANEIFNNATSETIQWYNNIRPTEEAKIESLIDDLYNSENQSELKSIVSKSSKITKVKEILKESGMDVSNIDEILNNKNLVKKIATIQNNVNMQQMHLNELISSYEKYGDYRKLSAVINSATQQMNHFDPNTNQNVQCSYGHPDDYWTEISENNSFNSSFDELCADYFSLAAHGRKDVIATMEKIFGSELMDAIKGTFKDIAETALETIMDRDE